MRTPSTTAPDFDSCHKGSAWTRTIASSPFTSDHFTSAQTRRNSRRVACAAIIAVLGLIVAAPAQARVTHIETGSFGSFPQLTSISVNQANGDVYVLDAGHDYGGTSTIEKFDAAGNPTNFSALGSPSGTTNLLDGSANGYGDADATPLGRLNGGQLAIDNSGGPTQGDIYVESSFDYVTYAFAPSGAYLGRLTDITAAPYHGGQICGVAVDSTGAVYVSWQSHVDRYIPSGGAAQDSDFAGQIRNPNPVGCRMAGGGNGIGIYLTSSGSFDQNSGPVRPYSPNQFVGLNNPDTSQTSSNIWDVAVDQTHGDIYGLQASSDMYGSAGDQIVNLDSSGIVKDTFGKEGQVVGNYGIAVNATTETVYAHTANNAVGIFTPGVTPDVATNPATGVDRGGVVLNGHIDGVGAGEIQNCHFEYGINTNYGSTMPCSDATPFPGARNVAANVAGLELEAAYHYRLVGANSTGSNVGGDQTFKTHAAVLDLQTDEPNNLTPHSATLNASFTGDNHNTTYFFEWGTTKAYSHTTTTAPGEQPGATGGSTALSANIQGLSTFSPYHYRVVATNSFGTTYGADRLFFSAPPGAPLIANSSSSDVGATAAKLNVVINPNDGDTVYRFDYGLGSSYGLNTPSSESIGDDLADYTVSAEVTGLLPGTTYHFRAVAMNVGGTTHGPDQEFTTPDRPWVDQSSASALTQNGATLGAQITPNSSPTTYHFDYGLTTSYGSSTAESAPVGSDVVAHGVSSQIAGLTPGVTYHYRVVATNSVGSTFGPDLKLTTVDATLGGEVPQLQPQPACKRGFVRKGDRKGDRCVKRRHNSRRHHHRRSRSHG